jgi:hypothetical protein
MRALPEGRDLEGDDVRLVAELLHSALRVGAD